MRGERDTARIDRLLKVTATLTATSLFVTLEEPTAPMVQEAAEAGYYHSTVSGRDYPAVQILTIRGLLDEGKKPNLPLLVLPAYQRAERVRAKAAEQAELFGG